MNNNNVDVEEYIRKIIRTEKKPTFYPIPTASRNRAVKTPMIEFEGVQPAVYVVGGALSPAGE